MKNFKIILLSLVLSVGVHGSDLESITSVEKFSHAMQRYEILTSTSEAVEADIQQFRENITKFWMKNKNLLKRLREKTFINTIDPEYQIVDSSGNVLCAPLGQQMLQFKTRASAAQMSGVLMYDHNRQIKGEDAGVYLPDVGDHHKKHVASIIEQIAPLSFLPKTLWEGALEIFKRFVDASRGQKFKVANWSIVGADGSSWKTLWSLFFLQEDCLIVKAAGNNGAELTSDQAPDRMFFQELLKIRPNALDDGMIIVGSVNHNNERSFFSNVPGDDENFQRNFIYALGEDVLAKVDDHYMRLSGTSMATPIVTGVAALIAGAYPQFSKTDIKECILESARQSFFVYGHQVDVQDNPDMWGRGILDGAQALAYAKLKSEGKTKQEIKDILKNRKAILENLSAFKIQAVCRAKKR